MRASISPFTGLHFRPAFWGVERDLADVVNRMNSVWEGAVTTKPSVNFTDFKETEKAYLLTIDMPGVNKKNLDIEIEEERISISGLRKKTFSNENQEDQKLMRSIALPQNVDKDKIQAHLEDGVLYLAMPKLTKEEPKKIKISEGLESDEWTRFLVEEEKIQN